jgi:hypothetical protein
LRANRDGKLLSFAIQTGKHATSTGFHATWGLAKHSVVGEWEGLHSLGKGASSFARGREAGFDFLNSRMLEARAKHLPQQEAQRHLAEAEARQTARQMGRLAGDAGHSRTGHAGAGRVADVDPNGLRRKPNGVLEHEVEGNHPYQESRRATTPRKPRQQSLVTQKKIRRQIRDIQGIMEEHFVKPYMSNPEDFRSQPINIHLNDKLRANVAGRLESNLRNKFDWRTGKPEPQLQLKMKLPPDITEALGKIAGGAGGMLGPGELQKLRGAIETSIHEIVHGSVRVDNASRALVYSQKPRYSVHGTALNEGFTEAFTKHNSEFFIKQMGLDQLFPVGSDPSLHPGILGVSPFPSYTGNVTSVNTMVDYLIGQNPNLTRNEVYSRMLFNNLPDDVSNSFSQFIWENHPTLQGRIDKNSFVNDMTSFINDQFNAHKDNLHEAGGNIVRKIEEY